MADRQNGFTEMLPGLVRVAFSSWWRSVQWAVNTTTSTMRNVVTAAANGESPVKIATDTADGFRAMVRGALGIEDASANDDRNHSRPGSTTAELIEKGRQLLRDSADVWYHEDTHPAFAAILEELTPDEARILRFLFLKGPQPSVDVRTNRPLGRGSEKVASGLSMIGLNAGVRNLAWTNAHLGNLNRLGLVDFPHEEVVDPSIYQLLEVQPDVQEAMRQAGRSPKTVHRSIELTAFGEDFCRTCLPVDEL
jgi:hypothetical protein